MSTHWLSCYLALVSSTYRTKQPTRCYEERRNNRCSPGLCRAGMCCVDDEICWNGKVVLKYSLESICKDENGYYTVTRSTRNYDKSQRNLIWRLLPGKDALEATFDLLEYVARRSGCGLYVRHGVAMFVDWHGVHHRVELNQWYSCYTLIAEPCQRDNMIGSIKRRI